ncbi:bifunctional transcriptional regulator/glucokinase [Niveibacterium umoris]|uniref:Glucokinase n=1 Tax=Niveibacterium umoris TaxID=1193620 RepID=A0A840BHV6_9RHOO|nr:glucokinase [Niveibacterium umoris]MBB4011172.1 glucokinase [Niveibacterium umoris]
MNTRAARAVAPASVAGLVRAFANATPFPDGPRLLADVGATNARFALETAPGHFEAIEVLRCDDYAGIVDVIRSYLERVRLPRVSHAGIAIANPIGGDLVRMTNRDWTFSIEEVRQRLDLSTLLVVNDFTALAMALRHLSSDQRMQVGGGTPQLNSVIGLLGPGTGLGVSALIPTEDRWVTLGSEGGHTSFAPNDERELDVLRYCWRQYPHVSGERLISGPGIELTYRALCERDGVPALPRKARDVVEAALAGTDPVCVETLDCFCGMLGTVASNLAVTLGALGGIYIGGGIVPRLGARFEHSPFRARFEAKGRFSDYLADVPTYVITAPYPAFHGVSAILADHLRGRTTGDGSLLDKIRSAAVSLSKAEQRVSQLVLARPRTVLNDPIIEIARQAEVSQPTVIRFCRSLGFQGLSDFKLKLASGLTGTVPVRHSQVRHGDSAPDVSAKVMENTASAILKLRDVINVSAIEEATRILGRARRIEFYAIGNAAVVALDAQFKFFRFRIPCVAYSDTHMQIQSAELLGPGDVVVVVSTSGRPSDLLRAVDAALAAGAEVVAITASKSPLSRKATVSIGLDHVEDGQTFISMVVRVLQLVVVDVLAVGVALQRGADNPLGALSDITQHDDERPFENENPRSRISHVSG